MKQHLAGGVMSSCGDSDGIPQIYSSQEGRKSKLLLPEEEPEDADMLEIGIEGAVTHHYGGAGSSDMDIDEDEFNGLSKLKSRKSSPIKRLLQDVDICLINFFECIEHARLADEQGEEALHSDREDEPSSSAAVDTAAPLKTEAPHLASSQNPAANFQCSGQETY